MAALAYNSPRVQQLRRLIARRSSRHTDRLFVVEGPVLVAEAVAAGWECTTQFIAGGDAGDGSGIDAAGEVVELAGGVFERVASTEAPQSPLAIVRIPEHRPVAELLAEASFVVVLDRVRDPGNLGTILRSAEAAGADLIVLTPDSVDPYNPKVVRASAGALFHVPIVESSIEEVAAGDLELIGTTSHESPGRTMLTHTETELTGPVAVVMGNEAAGLPAEWTDDVGPIRRWMTIPHQGRSESLNVAMAATIVAFEVARQRREASVASTPTGASSPPR